jgi:hypothetical protein
MPLSWASVVLVEPVPPALLDIEPLVEPVPLEALELPVIEPPVPAEEPLTVPDVLGLALAEPLVPPDTVLPPLTLGEGLEVPLETLPLALGDPVDTLPPPVVPGVVPLVLGIVLDIVPLDVPLAVEVALLPPGLALGALETAPLSVPGEPGLPLIRPLEFGMRLASELPGLVTVEPPLDSVPPAPVPLTLLVELVPSAACACRLHSSKSLWLAVCAKAPFHAARKPAAVTSAVMRVRLFIVLSSVKICGFGIAGLACRERLQAGCHRPRPVKRSKTPVRIRGASCGKVAILQNDRCLAGSGCPRYAAAVAGGFRAYPRESGETGRRAGLRIQWAETPLGVRLPPLAPIGDSMTASVVRP